MVRVKKIDFEGQVAWRKYPEPPRANVYSQLHKLVSPILPTVFKATDTAGGAQALHEEAARLKTFAEAGILVPPVLAVDEHSIVLGHVGQSVPDHFHKETDTGKRASLLQQTAVALANLHSAGLVHGRPSLKDMFLSEVGEVYLLDLEEDPLTIMSLEQAQARDVWLFLSSAHRICGASQDELNSILGVYKRNFGSALDVELSALAKKLNPFCRIVGFLKFIRLGRDVTAALTATRTLNFKKSV